jgi:hypothetical protein
MFSSDIINDALTGVGPNFENISFKNSSCPYHPCPPPHPAPFLSKMKMKLTAMGGVNSIRLGFTRFEKQLKVPKLGS